MGLLVWKKSKIKCVYPSASGETLGGVAVKLETITLCEAAGFDIIIIETVGVGQAKQLFTVWLIFSVVKISGAGDELQGIKRGLWKCRCYCDQQS
jgi:LAO/AO transport system kinase